MNTGYKISPNLSANISLTGKTAGWIMGNPFLDDNIGLRVGLRYNVL